MPAFGLPVRNSAPSLLLMMFSCVLYGFFGSSAAAADPRIKVCQHRVEGQSLMYGQQQAGSSVFLDQARVAAGTKAGRIKRLNTYYSPEGCVTGVKPVYASGAAVSQLIGVQNGMKEISLELSANETVNRADISYDSRCIRYIRWYTNSSRDVTVGSQHPSITSKLAVATPPKPQQLLMAFKGRLDSTGALAQMQLVWGEAVCRYMSVSVAAPAAVRGRPHTAALLADKQPAPAPAPQSFPPAASAKTQQTTAAPKGKEEPVTLPPVQSHSKGTAAAATVRAAEVPPALQPAVAAAAKPVDPHKQSPKVTQQADAVPVGLNGPSTKPAAVQSTLSSPISSSAAGSTAPAASNTLDHLAADTTDHKQPRGISAFPASSSNQQPAKSTDTASATSSEGKVRVPAANSVMRLAAGPSQGNAPAAQVLKRADPLRSALNAIGDFAEKLFGRARKNDAQAPDSSKSRFQSMFGDGDSDSLAEDPDSKDISMPSLAAASRDKRKALDSRTSARSQQQQSSFSQLQQQLQQRPSVTAATRNRTLNSSEPEGLQPPPLPPPPPQNQQQQQQQQQSPTKAHSQQGQTSEQQWHTTHHMHHRQQQHDTPDHTSIMQQRAPVGNVSHNAAAAAAGTAARSAGNRGDHGNKAGNSSSSVFNSSSSSNSSSGSGSVRPVIQQPDEPMDIQQSQKLDAQHIPAAQSLAALHHNSSEAKVTAPVLPSGSQSANMSADSTVRTDKPLVLGQIAAADSQAHHPDAQQDSHLRSHAAPTGADDRPPAMIKQTLPTNMSLHHAAPTAKMATPTAANETMAATERLAPGPADMATAKTNITKPLNMTSGTTTSTDMFVPAGGNATQWIQVNKTAVMSLTGNATDNNTSPAVRNLPQAAAGVAAAWGAAQTSTARPGGNLSSAAPINTTAAHAAGFKADKNPLAVLAQQLNATRSGLTSEATVSSPAAPTALTSVQNSSAATAGKATATAAALSTSGLKAGAAVPASGISNSQFMRDRLQPDTITQNSADGAAQHDVQVDSTGPPAANISAAADITGTAGATGMLLSSTTAVDGLVRSAPTAAAAAAAAVHVVPTKASTAALSPPATTAALAPVAPRNQTAATTATPSAAGIPDNLTTAAAVRSPAPPAAMPENTALQTPAEVEVNVTSNVTAATPAVASTSATGSLANLSKAFSDMQHPAMPPVRFPAAEGALPAASPAAGAAAAAEGSLPAATAPVAAAVADPKPSAVAEPATAALRTLAPPAVPALAPPAAAQTAPPAVADRTHTAAAGPTPTAADKPAPPAISNQTALAAAGPAPLAATQPKSAAVADVTPLAAAEPKSAAVAEPAPSVAATPAEPAPASAVDPASSSTPGLAPSKTPPEPPVSVGNSNNTLAWRLLDDLLQNVSSQGTAKGPVSAVAAQQPTATAAAAADLNTMRQVGVSNLGGPTPDTQQQIESPNLPVVRTFDNGTLDPASQSRQHQQRHNHLHQQHSQKADSNMTAATAENLPSAAALEPANSTSAAAAVDAPAHSHNNIKQQQQQLRARSQSVQRQRSNTSAPLPAASSPNLTGNITMALPGRNHSRQQQHHQLHQHATTQQLQQNNNTTLGESQQSAITSQNASGMTVSQEPAATPPADSQQQQQRPLEKLQQLWAKWQQHHNATNSTGLLARLPASTAGSSTDTDVTLVQAALQPNHVNVDTHTQAAGAGEPHLLNNQSQASHLRAGPPATAAANATALPVAAPPAASLTLSTPAAQRSPPAAAAAAATGTANSTGASLTSKRHVSPQCRSKPTMCDASIATPSDPAYCPVVAPFTTPQCVGGCCVSTGKCSSSDCTASGLGRGLPHMTCQGMGSYGGFGYDPSGDTVCRHLACRLALPGCVTGAAGGNCVGKLVAVSTADQLHPEGLRLLGSPCLEMMPGDLPLNLDGSSSQQGEFVARLWSVCDCQAEDKATAAAPSNTADLQPGKNGSSDTDRLGMEDNPVLQKILAMLQGSAPSGVNNSSIIKALAVGPTAGSSAAAAGGSSGLTQQSAVNSTPNGLDPSTTGSMTAPPIPSVGLPHSDNIANAADGIPGGSRAGTPLQGMPAWLQLLGLVSNSASPTQPGAAAGADVQQQPGRVAAAAPGQALGASPAGMNQEGPSNMRLPDPAATSQSSSNAGAPVYMPGGVLSTSQQMNPASVPGGAQAAAGQHPSTSDQPLNGLADVLLGIGRFAVAALGQGNGSSTGSSAAVSSSSRLAPGTVAADKSAAQGVAPSIGFGQLAVAALAALQNSTAKAGARSSSAVPNSRGRSNNSSLLMLTTAGSGSAPNPDTVDDVEEDYDDGVIRSGRYKGYISSRGTVFSHSSSNEGTGSVISSDSSGDSTGSSAAAQQQTAASPETLSALLPAAGYRSTAGAEPPRSIGMRSTSREQPEPAQLQTAHHGRHGNSPVANASAASHPSETALAAVTPDMSSGNYSGATGGVAALPMGLQALVDPKAASVNRTDGLLGDLLGGLMTGLAEVQTVLPKGNNSKGMPAPQARWQATTTAPSNILNITAVAFNLSSSVNRSTVDAVDDNLETASAVASTALGTPDGYRSKNSSNSAALGNQQQEQLASLQEGGEKATRIENTDRNNLKIVSKQAGVHPGSAAANRRLLISRRRRQLAKKR